MKYNSKNGFRITRVQISIIGTEYNRHASKEQDIGYFMNITGLDKGGRGGEGGLGRLKPPVFEVHPI